MRSAALVAVLAANGLPAFTASARDMSRQRHPPDLVPEDEALRLSYDAPGTADNIIEEGLPIGNGRIGALLTGDPTLETLFISDATLWTGGLNDALLANGQFPYTASTFGTMSLLAKLTIDSPGHEIAGLDGYRRTLDLSNGLTSVGYRKEGVEHRRTAFASQPDQVIVIHLTQNGDDNLSGRVRLAGTHGETTRASGRESSIAGMLPNGLAYGCLASVRELGGTVRAVGGELVFADCSELLIVVSGGTNYRPDACTGFRDPAIDPLIIARDRAVAAQDAGEASLLASHVADHRRLFEAQQVRLGTSSPKQRAMDTPQRLMARATYGSPPDPELEASYLQFGRYLMIAGSRDSLPINLQGLWLDRNDPDWMADYHTDINIQMNYWLPDRAGLAASFKALADYCLSQLSSWTSTTQALFQDPRNWFRNSSGKVAGWTVAISTNIYGGGGWWWNPTGGAWLANTLFDHFEFTQDRRYLERIYPLLKGACAFWEARLLRTTITDPDTGALREVLIDDGDWSAEHGPRDAKGITYAQELVWQLFANFQTAAAALARDARYAETIRQLQDALYVPRVSRGTGRLEEWMGGEEDVAEPRHRHLSPLIGLFPGDRIAPDTAPPALVEGARRLLDARGMTSFGWAMAWRGLCWARLKNATRAYRSVLTVIKPAIAKANGTAANLFDMYSFGDRSTFQIDANLGTPTCMIEMLVYSRPGLIELLPAAPDAWREGRITSVGAKGGFVVDLDWRDRQAVKAVIRSVGGTATRLRYGRWERAITLSPGESVTLSPPPRRYADEPDTSPYTLVERATGLLLAPSESGIILLRNDGNLHQQWQVGAVDKDRITFTNEASGLVLAAAEDDASDHLVVAADAASEHRHWRIKQCGDGWSAVQNVATGLFLSAQSESDNAASVTLFPRRDGACRQWRIIRA